MIGAVRLRFGCRLELQCGSSPDGPASFAWWGVGDHPPKSLLFHFFSFGEEKPSRDKTRIETGIDALSPLFRLVFKSNLGKA